MALCGRITLKPDIVGTLVFSNPIKYSNSVVIDQDFLA